MGCGSSKSSNESARAQPENGASPQTAEQAKQSNGKTESRRSTNDPTGITMGQNEQPNNTEQQKCESQSIRILLHFIVDTSTH